MQARLIQVDALRGIAAMAVVLFHYTSHFHVVYPGWPKTIIDMKFGQYGVQLFFIISGFVIYMTLERCKKPLDFVMSRLSRLFPTYWTAIVITLGVTHALAVESLRVPWSTGAANFLMLHGLVDIRHVDPVYWTLQVEMLFYIGMLILFATALIARIEWFLLGILSLCLFNETLEFFFKFGIPWRLYGLLILKHAPWFVIGISIFRLTRGDASARAERAVFVQLIILAIIIIGLSKNAAIAAMAAAFTIVMYGAAKEKLPLLASPVVVWLGAISYPLYLIHQNVGWSVMLRLNEAGWSPHLIVALVITLSLALAYLLHRLVEKPATLGLRAWYRSRPD